MLPRAPRFFPVARLLRQLLLTAVLARFPLAHRVRFNSTDSTKTEPHTNSASGATGKQGVPIGKLDEPPKLRIGFTCKKCNTRSSHTMSKQAYETGLVLIQCPGCKNRHLIADNLKVFSEGNFNLQKHLEKRGELISDDPSKLPVEESPQLSSHAIEVDGTKGSSM